MLFEHGETARAEPVLWQVLERNPRNANRLDHLGVVCLRRKRLEEGVTAYRRALEITPRSAITHLGLGYALRDTGHRAEAAASWQRALKLAPNTPLAEAARKPLAEAARGP